MPFVLYLCLFNQTNDLFEEIYKQTKKARRFSKNNVWFSLDIQTLLINSVVTDHCLSVIWIPLRSGIRSLTDPGYDLNREFSDLLPHI